MSEFKFGKCIYCGEEKALCNDVCVDCQDKVDMPYFMKDIFGGFSDEK